MRVVVNQLVTAGLKTGVGHYTIQFVRALRQLPGVEVGGRAPGALRSLRKLWKSRSPRPDSGAPASSSRLRRWASALFGSVARVLLRQYAWWSYTGRRYDL